MCNCSNSPDVNLTISYLDTNGVFEVSPFGNLTMQEHSPSALNVTFHGISTGDWNSWIKIESDIPTAPVQYINLFGSVNVPLRPEINLNQSSMDFGEVLLGQSSDQTLVVSNVGTETLTVSSLSPSIDQFLTNPSTFTLQPGNHQNVTVSFSPDSRKQFTSQLTILSNDPDAGSLALSLSGKGVAPDIKLSTPSLNFETVMAGAKLSKSLIIQNIGNTALNISSIFSNNPVFEVNENAVSITPSETKDVAISFSPIEAGQFAGIITINSDDADNSVLTINVQGKGIAPAISFSAPNLDFGEINLKTTSKQNLTVSNSGDSALTITQILSSSPQFVPKIGTVPIVLQPGEDREIQIFFAPLAEIKYSAVLEFVSDDPKAPKSLIYASAQGVKPVMVFSENEVDVGSVIIGDKRSAEFSVSNVGSGTLHVSAIYTDGSFSVVPDSLVLKPNASASVRVTYAPTEIGSNATWINLASDAYDSTSKIHVYGKAEPDLDLKIEHVEVTQAIQDMSNSIPLVSGKLTGVRIYIKASTKYSPAEVTGVDGLIFVDGIPFNSVNGPITVPISADRNKINDTLNFILPKKLSGDINLKVVINADYFTRTFQIKENNYDNNTYSQNFNFTAMFPTTIAYVPISYLGVGLPSNDIITNGAEWANKLFPIDAINYTRKPPISFNLPLYSNDKHHSNTYDLLNRVRLAGRLGNNALQNNMRVYGWLPSGIFKGGIAYYPYGGISGFGDASPASGSKIFAHEVGHMFNLHHSDVTKECDSFIGETGFDILKQIIMPGGLICSLMEPYVQNPPWIMPNDYRHLFGEFSQTSTKKIIGSSGKTLLIGGVIFTEGEGEFFTAYSTDGDAVSEAGFGEDNEYYIRAKDEDGNVLYEVPISFEFDETEAIERAKGFMAEIPDDELIISLEVVHGDETLLRSVRSDSPPVVAIKEPRGGDRLGENLHVSWTASDPDDDKLHYSILYSTDAGGTWTTIGVELERTELNYSLINLGGSNKAMVRVVASDGLNTSVADSEMFEVSSKPPQITIVKPLENETILDRAPVILSAIVTDLEDGIVSDGNINWYSSLNGELGSSEEIMLTGLDIGDHELTVVAVDSDGYEAVATVSFHVVAGDKAPRAVASGPEIFDEGGVGMLDGTTSSDPNKGDVLSFNWKQTSGPVIELDDSSSAKPTFTVPQVHEDMVVKFLLEVSDQDENRSTDLAEFLIKNVYFPRIKVEPSHVDFGIVDIGTSSIANLTISNEGSERLVVSDITFSDTGFQTDPVKFEIESGQSRQIAISFSPMIPQKYYAVMHILSNAWEDSQVFVELTGATLDVEQDNFQQSGSGTVPVSAGNAVLSPEYKITGGCSLIVR